MLPVASSHARFGSRETLPYPAVPIAPEPLAKYLVFLVGGAKPLGTQAMRLGLKGLIKASA
jgi:hypothetical protein